MADDSVQLRLFEGREVEAATYRATGAVELPGLDGLEYRETTYLLIEARCTEIKFKPLSKDDPELLTREHTLTVERARTFPDRFEAARILEGLASAVPPGDER
jgi:hypothetical protein